ncbi:IS5 family transposase [Pseudomonas putida]|jgi:IS5 family transposase|uniref:IS5 family transposase n=1 Tax=Pseudomonas putida TaxID=303 RepID=UPI0011C80A33|nr:MULTISPECIES: IS5 family transposase [Pseudomonas]MDD2056112.1 IS5 family transposase [Pseudomonas putida]MDD2057919.1 IS5 family transposase [Pseudomonas putida]MDD2058115.1 IS5 family transposase [Pseudomonas putida]TXR38445.1 IS5 family transposase [Pseudomonas mendocina]
MKQITFAQAEHQNKKKVTRRERFLAEMNVLVPWQRLLDALSPSYYPDSAGKRGRPPTPLERMLRIYFLQQWYGLADEALEDAIYDSQAMRDFVGIDLSIESVPDATTLLRFRHLLERHSLTQRIFEEINASLSERGLFMREGTIVDATIIAAAPSTKNKAKQRDPSMKQTRKGNQWFFGMKAHIGVDAVTGLTHSVVATSANQADITVAEQLLRDGKEPVYADAGYTGLGKRLAGCGDSLPALRIAARRSTIKKMEDGPEKQIMQRIEHCKASIRAKVEHPFHVIKNLFGHRKVRYRGMEKNQAQLFSLFALANLVLAKRCYAMTDGVIAS